MSDTWYRDPVKLPPFVDGFGRRWLLNGECLDVLPEPDDRHPDVASFDFTVTVMMAMVDEYKSIIEDR